MFKECRVNHQRLAVQSCFGIALCGCLCGSREHGSSYIFSDRNLDLMVGISGGFSSD